MAKIKVHELAKELGKESKDVIAFLSSNGIEAKAQSGVEDDMAAKVRANFAPKAEKPAKPAAKAEAPAKAEGDAAKKHYLYVKRDSAMFLLLLDTGLRVSEMLGTDIIDFDLNDCSANVIRKGGDKDIVYYSDECKEYLEEYFIQQRLEHGLVKSKDLHFPAFTTTTGKRLGVRAVEKLVKHYIELCLPQRTSEITPHKLRSSFAMSYYEASGHDIVKLKEKLHHANIETTNVYARASRKDMKDTRNILQGLR